MWHTSNQKALAIGVGPGLWNKVFVQYDTGGKIRMKEFGSNNLSFNGIKSISLDTCKQITNFRSFINATLPMLLQVCDDLVLIHLHPHIFCQSPTSWSPPSTWQAPGFSPLPLSCCLPWRDPNSGWRAIYRCSYHPWYAATGGGLSSKYTICRVSIEYPKPYCYPWCTWKTP